MSDVRCRISLFLLLLMLAVTTVSAQQRLPCVRSLPSQVAKTRGTLGYPYQDWDPDRVYRLPVVLISFSDCDFSVDDASAFYNRMLNEPGFNEGAGKGSMADYFREQSGGLFNLQFDVYGPIKVSSTAKSSSKYNYGDHAMREAMNQLAGMTDEDFYVYDWNGDGEVDQVLFIAASFTGNSKLESGYIWPNTGPAIFNAPGNVPVNTASISCELWRDSTSCGIGTIIHEFAHCLGLPDIYPTGCNVFSVVDEWDLMDGGNYTNKGWCPPNFSATEKMLMGWLTPTELTEATTVTGMKPVSEGGEVFIIRSSGNDSEFYMLENRQRTGWDYGIPGQGLVIFHVDYDREMWSNNYVNSYPGRFRYDMFHADGRDYLSWDPSNSGRDYSKYTSENWLHNRYLSTSVYPYVDELVENRSLTDDSNPAASLFSPNSDGVNLMSKPITNIQMAEDGTISFDFLGGTTAVEGISTVKAATETIWYDLNGRRLSSPPVNPGIYIVRYTDGTTRKIKI